MPLRVACFSSACITLYHIFSCSLVKKDFFAGRIKGCRAYFENNGYWVEAGYCCVILDDLNKAKKLFTRAKDYDNRALWGLFLLQLIKDDIRSFPTYFQVRNFLELDLSIFIMYCKEKYVEKIIRYVVSGKI